jgi:hypothetical protein
VKTSWKRAAARDSSLIARWGALPQRVVNAAHFDVLLSFAALEREAIAATAQRLDRLH